MADGENLPDLLRASRLLPPSVVVTNAVRPTDAAAAPDGSFPCPECQIPLTEGDWHDHLVAAHAYLALSGTLLPRHAALSCLWDRVFTTGDLQAHEQLCLLLSGGGGPATEPSRYARALEEELQRRLNPAQLNRRDLARLIRNLRQSNSAGTHFWHLLAAAEPRVRSFGRELLLPEVGESLAEESLAPAEVRRWLDKLCPIEDVWEKIRVCQRLPQFGASKSAVRECLRHLQGERPVACPECGAAVPKDQLEGHLRQSHQIFQFRGERRSLQDTFTALLTAVCGANADYEAWEFLEALAGDEYGAETESFLTAGLIQTLETVSAEHRVEALNSVAEVLAGSDRGRQMTLLLAESPEPVARHLALLIAARLRPPLSHALIKALRPLLARRQAPVESQLAAAAALLQSTGKDGRAAAKVVHALIAGCRKTRALDRLHRFEQQAGSAPAISQRYAAIESRMRMRCPRCRVQLFRPEMARHLWSEHALLLDGRRVREPWRLVEDWIDDYGRGNPGDQLIRCRTLGQFLDPDQGLLRVYRLVLARGIDDVEARQILLAQAKQRRATLCPHCYALVPIPAEVVPHPLNQSHGRLSLGGYCVHVSETGLSPRLTMEAPGRLIYRGREPGRWLTRRGALLLLAGPLVAAALMLAVLLPYLQIQPFVPVTVALWLAFVSYLGVRIWWRHRPKPLDAAVDYAWSQLVPQLHAADFSIEDSAFLGGLAVTSIGHGHAERRAESLARVLRITENAVAGRAAPLAHLAALRRLELADMTAAGADLVPPMVAQIGRCFEGELPLAFAQWLLADWDMGGQKPGNLLRLRVLLCDRAFEAGLEVSDVLEAVRTAPALAEVLQVEHPDELGQLRLLWSLRPRRPWDGWSEAVTVFELANDPEACCKLLGQYPDLLLVDRGMPAIFLCGRGVFFQGVLFTESGRSVEVKARQDIEAVEYEVIVAEHRFQLPSDPTPLVKRLEHWFRYHFHEFLPQVSGVYAWHAPQGSQRLHFQEAILCPECRQLLLARIGEVGRMIDKTRSRDDE